ncbi:MAG: hypothetical protein VX910_07250, partial [Candidatus Latescibacterota bacterium]|nr:hypothetical protein [Candidatus Latescibacterota bacterium]
LPWYGSTHKKERQGLLITGLTATGYQATFRFGGIYEIYSIEQIFSVDFHRRFLCVLITAYLFLPANKNCSFWCLIDFFAALPSK